MPPSRTTSTSSNPPRRRGPAFKPPTQVRDQDTAATKATNAARSKSANSTTGAGRLTKKVPASKSGFRPASTTIISSEDDEAEEEQDDDLDMSDDDVEEDTTTHSNTRTSAATAPPPASQDDAAPAIPPRLLTRLLHEGFEDKDIKIGKEAMAVVGKYMETFVREALARAAFEREEVDGDGGGGIGDGFLQVEDLEKTAPQLLLDF
ncbi:hypothetical protein W97_01480 [Coniosporium apollinis CBS 100218]|uniref:Centromere protein X n=1 Tax=Coniosporium apollinis (strain CBS 100218) TaxID=1168221 RepID=R7YKC5_CONA1|nr:uncharacterized protein W97_01480 [Coniosporium apollinis CBS 100218]EON62259.1 hypothetical protein W97_01480 [Coniosporium apollinis CBS 100218]